MIKIPHKTCIIHQNTLSLHRTFRPVENKMKFKQVKGGENGRQPRPQYLQKIALRAKNKWA